MSTTSSVVTLTLIIPSLLLILLPIAVVVALQVWLCRRESRWLGLILPVLSFLLSFLLCLSFSSFTLLTPGSGSSQLATESEVIISPDGDRQSSSAEDPQSSASRMEITPQAVLTVALVFLVSNIPTVIFLGIFLHYKNRRDFQEELHRMTVQDLE